MAVLYATLCVRNEKKTVQGKFTSTGINGIRKLNKNVIHEVRETRLKCNQGTKRITEKKKDNKIKTSTHNDVQYVQECQFRIRYSRIL